MEHTTGRESDQSPTSTRRVRLLMILLAISLILHASTIGMLFYGRLMLQAQARELATELERAQQQVIAVTIPIKLPVSVHTEIAVRKTISIPINTSIPLDTTFQIPINTPFGNYEVPVPIKGSVPVRMTTPVELDETIPISTTISIDATLPLELPVRETFLGEYLLQLRARLLDLAGE